MNEFQKLIDSSGLTAEEFVNVLNLVAKGKYPIHKLGTDDELFRQELDNKVKGSPDNK